MTRWPGQAGPAAGRAGLIAIGASVALTFAVAVAGPSVMEPALPGRPGQPPWAWAAHLSAYLAVPLTAAALAAGTLGLVLVLRALRGGWSVPARTVLIAGLLAAAVLTLVPPFGSSDQLSYAAYGRMLVTGHNPYTTTPAQLAALGDPVARAVQDWFTTSSVYGPLATGIQGLAALIGGTSARLTVFMLGLANLAAFAGTALLLHRVTRGDPSRQLRAALLWAANPLLLQLLIAGAHVDVQAAFFAVAAVAAVFRPGLPGTGRAALAGVLAGLGFAVKVSDVLVVLGLAIALAVRCWPDWRRLLPPLAGLAAGFAATAGAALAIGGSAMLTQLSRESGMVSIGSPWRVLRTIIHLAVAGPAATDVVKAGAVALAVVLAVLLVRGLPGVLVARQRRGAAQEPALDGGPAGTIGDRTAGIWDGGFAATAGGVTFALALAWLFAWPYVLPWYDALAWALLPLVPAATAAGRRLVDTVGWLLLARTAALGFGYLPARQTGVRLPSGLTWLQPVIRHGITPAVLAGATVWLIVLLARSRPAAAPPAPAAGTVGPAAAATKAG